MKLKFLPVLAALFAATLSVYAQDLQVQANFTGDRWIARDATIALRFSRSLQPSDGKLAIFVGHTDMTDLFVSVGKILRYTPTIMLLPAGESELIVSLVTGNNVWQEIARFPLRVKTGLGFERARVDPRMSINNNGQVAEGHSPDENDPERRTYQDFTGQFNVSTEHIRSALKVNSQWDFVGASEQNQALQFGGLGNAADQIDLSSYLVEMQVGRTGFYAGHINHGRQKHLINSFSSRGVQLATALGQHLDLSFAAMNANEIVGWQNFLGLKRKQNRIFSGTVGLDVLSRFPGTVRFEGSYMDGRRLAVSNFNQENINDAEKSHGFGFQIKAGTGDQRLQFEGGFARSSFTNPVDPFLSQGDELVPVQETTRNAQFANLSVAVLQNVSLSPTWQANLNVNLRHERVDPLYRSLAAFTQADNMENAVDVFSNIGSISAQYSHSRSEDNLDDIPSILKTKTRINSVNLAIPFSVIFANRQGAPWLLPMFSYSYTRVHQFGAGLPVNGGFNESHVPDQMSHSHNVGFDWSKSLWRFSYRLGYSLQDNRQPGRQNADFKNVNHNFNFGLTPFDRLDVGLDLAIEQAENQAADETNTTRNIGFNVTFKTTDYSVLTANIAQTHSENDVKTSELNNLFANAQWSLNFHLNRNRNRRLLSGQVFIRYSRNESDSRDDLFGFQTDTSRWTVNTGLNLSLF